MGGKTAAEAGKPQVFRSPVAMVIWVVWLLFAAANLVDLALQGRDHVSLIAAAILVLITGVAYVGALRPKVIVQDEALLIRNPLREHRIPWPNVARVDVSDLLRVHCRRPGPAQAGTGDKDKAISAWAVHYSRRRQYSQDVKARRAALRSTGRSGGRSGGMTQFGIPQSAQSRNRMPASYGVPNRQNQEAEALKVVQILNGRIADARAEQDNKRDTDQGTILTSYDGYQSGVASGRPLLTSRWNTPAILALVIPALILLVVCLI